MRFTSARERVGGVFLRCPDVDTLRSHCCTFDDPLCSVLYRMPSRQKRWLGAGVEGSGCIRAPCVGNKPFVAVTHREVHCTKILRGASTESCRIC